MSIKKFFSSFPGVFLNFLIFQEQIPIPGVSRSFQEFPGVVATLLLCMPSLRLYKLYV